LFASVGFAWWVETARGARSGRRPGRHDTKAEILAAARQCFAEAGYDRTTIRQVATRAGIDAALVHRRFGTKFDLFLAAVGLPVDLTGLVAEVVAGDPDGLGARVVRAFVELWDNAPLQGASFTGLIRLAAGDPAGAALLSGYISRNLAAAMTRALGVRDAERRVGLVGSQLLGIGVARYVLHLEPLAGAEPAEVADHLGWAVQQLFTQ
jgi:AcrR family transcriptional regulator